MASEHTAKAFDADLQELARLVAEMGGLAERQIADSVDSLVRRDGALGKQVVALDAELDRLQRQIEERAVLTIARRQPMAVDLREIVERIGDLAKNIAKRTLKIAGEARLPRAIVSLKSMHEIAATQLKDALDAYALRDIERAQIVWENDADLDALEDSVFRDLLTFMMEDPRNISFCTHLLFCSKNPILRKPYTTSSPARRCRWIDPRRVMPLKKNATRTHD